MVETHSSATQLRCLATMGFPVSVALLHTHPLAHLLLAVQPSDVVSSQMACLGGLYVQVMRGSATSGKTIVH